MRIRSVVMALVAAAGVAGAVTLTVPAHADDRTTTINISDTGDQLSLGHLARIVGKHLRVDVGTVNRAIVVTDLAGTPLPAAHLDILYSGRDAGEVKLLATVDAPDASTTVAELKKSGGQASASKINIRLPGFYVETTTYCNPIGCFRRIVIIERP